jgi:hypothetical protein
MRNYRVNLIALVLALIAAPSLSYAAPCSEVGSIIKVENTKVGPNEYVNFYIKTATPDFTVKAVQGPKFDVGEGDAPLIIKGNKWTEVAFKGVNWTCEIPLALHLPKPIIRQVSSTEQFEGYVTYVIGRQGKNYRGQTVTAIPGGRKISLKYR